MAFSSQYPLSTVNSEFVTWGWGIINGFPEQHHLKTQNKTFKIHPQYMSLNKKTIITDYHQLL